MRPVLALLAALLAPVSAFAAAPTIDAVASATGSVSTGSTITLTTSNANDIVLVWVACGFGTNSSLTLTAPHLTFTALYAPGTACQSINPYLAVYYAVASAPLTSEVITISTASGGFGQGTAVAVSGTNTAAPFDPNANAKASGSCASNCTGLTGAGLSTTNANALVLCGIVMSSTVTPTNFGTLTTDHVDYKQFYGHATYASAQTNNVIRAVNQADGNYSYCAAFTPGSVPGVTGGRLLFQ